jgi:hypothetical protein
MHKFQIINYTLAFLNLIKMSSHFIALLTKIKHMKSKLAICFFFNNFNQNQVDKIKFVSSNQ